MSIGRTMRQFGKLLAVAAITLVIGLSAGTARAGQTATVISLSPLPGTATFTVGVGIPKTVWNQASSGKKTWDIDVSITYLSVNNTIETVDSGLVAVAGTTLIGQVDGSTDQIQMDIPFDGHPAPGNQPSYQTTATLSKQ
jgi:hypothetical protein